jgi:hypothetical protein
MNFPVQGHFWLPGSPDKSVYGTLTFTRREGTNSCARGRVVSRQE